MNENASYIVNDPARKDFEKAHLCACFGDLVVYVGETMVGTIKTTFTLAKGYRYGFYQPYNGHNSFTKLTSASIDGLVEKVQQLVNTGAQL